MGRSLSPGRWERIKDLFASALEIKTSARADFLKNECLGDQQLLSEVEALLDENDRVGSFLTEPLFGNLAGQVFPSQREEILAGFRIVKLLGSGGMGQVYEAFELSKQREVALKVLNANFALNRDDISRFEREAWIGGRLDHPNIVKAYGRGGISGLHYISMEFMEGPSLATDILITKAEWDQGTDSKVRTERIRKMVRLFSEVADAVQHVHENGIIHRDIKPQNLLFTDGASKLLLSDFGLARDEAFSQLTRHGAFFGTIRYMSPEQLLRRNKGVDGRTDIWSLGVSLYEAVTLDLPYDANTEEGYISAVSTDEPMLARSRNQIISKDLETVLMKCLEKEPDARYQTAGELRDDLRRLAANEPILARRPSTIAKLNRLTKRNRKLIVTGVAAIACLTALLIAAYFFALAILRPPQIVIKPFTTLPGGEYEPKFSPDEKRVAFIWGKENERTFNVYVQNIDRSGLRRITSPDNVNEGSPAWSPDGAAIAFIRTDMSSQDSQVYIKPVLGGPERRITSLVPVEHAFQRRLDWSPDGKYLALADASGPGKPLAIFLVSPRDGSRSQVSTPIAGTQGDTAPAFSPDSKTLAFLRFGGSDSDDIYAMPVAGGTPRRLTADNSFISDYGWMPNGRELAVNTKRSGSIDLWITPVNGGRPRPANGAASGAYFIAVSPKEHLLALSVWAADTNIWRVDPTEGHPGKAKFTEIIASTMDDRSGQYSPDGKQVVFRSNQSGADEIWLADSSGKNQSQLTFFQGPLTGTPRWSNDGSQIAFDSRPTGHGDIFVILSKGGEPRRITTGGGDNVVASWSADGKTIYFASNRRGEWQIYKAPAEGESASHPAAQVTTHGGFSAFESPDGKWIYYAKGREVSGLWKIPIDGGEEVLVTPDLQSGFWGYWSIGRSAVFFISCDKSDHCSINSHSLTKNETNVVALLPKEPPFSDSGLSMTRDARSFLFPEVDHAQSNIMLGIGFR